MQAYEAHILAKTSAEPEERKSEYEAVTAEQIVELARHIFKSSNLVIAMKGKKSIKVERELKEIIMTLDQED